MKNPAPWIARSAEPAVVVIAPCEESVAVPVTSTPEETLGEKIGEDDLNPVVRELARLFATALTVALAAEIPLRAVRRIEDSAIRKAV